MRRFYLNTDKISENPILITGSDANHIKKVLRLKPGDRIEVLNGKGMDCEARINAIRENAVEIIISDSHLPLPEPPVQIVVGQALLKNKKMDKLIRPLTELGISKWLPIISERSVPRADRRRMVSRVERWRKIAIEALKQSGRGFAPEILAPVTFNKMIEISHNCDLKITFWEKAITPLRYMDISKRNSKDCRSIFILLGPEGGFSNHETEILHDNSFEMVSLGPRILRAETATLAACALIQYIFGDMGMRQRSMS